MCYKRADDLFFSAEIGHTGTECKEEATLPDVHRDGEGHRARDSKQMPQSDSRFEVGTDDRASAEVGDTRSNGVRFGGATEIPREGNADRKSHKSKDGALKNEQAFHEREVEFQGLFTPTFLPLLSGGHQETVGEAVGDKSVKQPSLIVDNKATQPLDAQCQCNPASTIAPIYGSEPLTPANPRHLSSSDPRKVSMSERRSSSRSDTSVRSLRSSLRDAKQPRSPKKVLFSIDNVVVSPSTSPTLQRRIAAGNKSDIIEVVSKLDAPDMVVGKADKDFDPYAWRRDAGSQSTKSALTNIPYTNGHANGSSRPQHPAAQIGVGGTSPSMGGDGFEHIRGGEEDDELFAFDEDISYRDRSGFVDGEAREEEVEADGLDTGSEELPTNSPHAGSLPIEIRWPARKDPRG